ncbi:Negative regulator of differentiation 1 [Fulvia fulva]|nr:Negative regulator of differentiation 1 [Fulvia fulva]KAK4620475.1 Negative regulator of differentiation 1 [Fulvia fulva]WPV17491.1 Negative regulator of differentiation 1 [Fulvia fulva]WPV32506.1 Negative regulator of differentiation 1 [Fulvia fulva]
MLLKHTSAQILGRADPASVTISRVEYDSLLRTSREFELLKTSLYQGGLTPETLALLIAGATVPEQQQRPVDSWADDYDDQPMPYCQPKPFVSGPSKSNGMSWRSNSNTGGFNLAPGSGAFKTVEQQPSQASLQVPNVNRNVSYGVTPSSVPEDNAFEADSFMDDGNTELDTTARGRAGETLRTLYFCNLSPKTSYKDLASVIKGGKVLSITIRSERSATVTFLDAAADYLTWSKRNDVYLHARRVEVRWAERQSNLNGHIANKITNGATRNILIRNAVDKGLTEQRIRDDMEHIHGLVIIEVTYQSGNAYVSTNSVHNALFARTCMMSRSDYRGCKIEFYPDECDVALPARAKPTPTAASEPTKRHMAPNNRFDMLNMSSNGSSGSDEGVWRHQLGSGNHAITDCLAENRDPLAELEGDSDDEVDSVHIVPRAGVRLDFLDSESTA